MFQSALPVFEFVPVVLAIIAVITSASSFNTVRRKSDAIIRVLTVVAALLLITAQTSWWQSSIVQGDLLGTWFANRLWTIFNSLVMIIFIIDTLPRNRK